MPALLCTSRFRKVDAALTEPQGCIKLQFEGSTERGGDSLSPQYQAHSAGDKLSPPRKAKLDAAALTEPESR
jgi:hypothetical protein